MGKGVLGHHAARERVDAAGLERRGEGFLAGDRVHVLHLEQLEIRLLPGRLPAHAVENFRELRAQTADVDRHVAQLPALAEAVQHGQQFLRLAEGEERDENAAAARQGC